LAVRGATTLWHFASYGTSIELVAALRAPAVFAWTAPAGAQPHDLAVLYAGKPRSEWMAVGRICSEPVRNRDGQRLAWVQWIPSRAPVGLDVMRARHSDSWPKLRNMAGQHARVPGKAAQALRRGLLRDPRAAAQWQKWAGPRTRLPHHLDPGELASSGYEPDPAPQLAEDHERHLQAEIAQRLIGLRRGIDADRHPALLRAANPALELRRIAGTLYNEDGYRREWDILLVDPSADRRLLLIEVKKIARATLQDAGVAQVLDYARLLAPLVPGWRIRPVVCAPRVRDSIIRDARHNRVEVWRYDAGRNRNQFVSLTAPPKLRGVWPNH